MMTWLHCRHEMYSDYKAHRLPMPDGLKLAIPRIQKLLEVTAISTSWGASGLASVRGMLEDGCPCCDAGPGPARHEGGGR